MISNILGWLAVWALANFILWVGAHLFCECPADVSKFFGKIYFVPLYWLSRAKMAALRRSGDHIAYACTMVLHNDGQYTRVIFGG